MCGRLEAGLRASVSGFAVLGVVGGDADGDPSGIDSVTQGLSSLPDGDGFLSGRRGLDGIEAKFDADVVESLGFSAERSGDGDGVVVGRLIGVVGVVHVREAINLAPLHLP